MKKVFYSILTLAAIMVSCQQSEIVPEEITTNQYPEIISDKEYVYNEGPMVMGEKFEIPYSVENLKKALENVSAETKALIPESSIVTTHYYVKFSPKNEAELSILKNNPKLILSEYPLDREILVDGCSYHDPALPENVPTYQYSTIEASYWKALSDTLSVENEVLIEAFMPDYYDDDVVSKAGQDIDPAALDELMAEAYKMTGHEYIPETKGGKWFPKGTITAYDNIVKAQVPVRKVRVRGTHLLKIREGLTDDNGNYSFEHSFRNNATMKIVWESDRWDIRDGNIGQAYFNGPTISGGRWDVAIANDDSKALRYSAIHRAAWRHYYGNNVGLSRPDNSRKEKIAYIHDDINEGGTNGDYNHQWGMGVWSDIRIAGKNIYGWRAPSEIFCTTCHEFGHAAHYTNATSTYKNSEERVIESWARFVQYILTRQEYVEMNALDSLYEKDTVGINNDVIMIKPDIEYNFQAVSVSSETVYTPLFIDLNDDYNQRDYYREAYYSSSTVAKATNDIIHDLSPKMIEDFVFASKAFLEIKNKLLEYCKNNPNNAKLYSINETSINNLFELYGL